ncbi:MAG TPA: triple tyrosine motif-containing protein, partial [Flavisolibacter sp.]|nr:triple tyrosine motif-containing protein [Flavisolibacter sp.]
MQYAGLYKWISPKNTYADSLVKIPSVGNDLVTKMAVDNKGFLWVTTEKKGVFAFETETGQIRFHWNNRPENDSLKIIEGFNCVLPFDDSLVYIATASRLYTFNRLTNKIVQKQLPGSLLGSIASIEKDDAGMLWISTTNGLYRFAPATGTLIFFNREDGIANDRFVLAAAYRTRNGRMLFGTDNAMVYFSPEHIRFPVHEQKIAFTSIQAGQKELPVDSVMALDVLTLGASENSLMVDFSSLRYSDNSPIQYKLEKIDREWHTADKDKRTSFPFLPPGRYTLLLRTINAEGIPSEVTTLNLHVLAPFYQRWWFYTLLAICTASLLFWLDRQRMKRKEALQKVRTD